MDHEPSVLFVDQLELAVRTDLPVKQTDIKRAPVVTVDVAKSTFRDGPLDGAKLRAAHESIVRDIEEGKAPKSDPPDPRRLILLIDRRAPWRLVAQAIETGNEAGFDRVMIVFLRPPKTPPPPHTKTDDEIARVIANAKDGNAATEIAKYTSAHITGCPALISLFGEVGAASQEDNTGLLLNGIGPALRKCNCGTDPDVITSIMWALAGNPHPIGAIDVELDPKAKPFAFAADTTWADASKQLLAGTKALWATTPAR